MTFIPMPTSEPPTAPQQAVRVKSGRDGWRLAGGIVLVAIITAAATVALVFSIQGRGHIGNLNSENRHYRSQVKNLTGEVGNLETALNGLATKQAGDLNKVNGALVPLSQLATSTCSTDLTGSSGPATYYFWCTDQKPAGSTG